jgi:hypothetical protein
MPTVKLNVTLAIVPIIASAAILAARSRLVRKHCVHKSGKLFIFLFLSCLGYCRVTRLNQFMRGLMLNDPKKCYMLLVIVLFQCEWSIIDLTCNIMWIVCCRAILVNLLLTRTNNISR